jgi:enoyl-CoA hydratase
MSEPQNLLTERAGAVAVVTVNRPAKLNALDAATRERLIATLEELRVDRSVRVVVLTGSGQKAFIAGSDIGEFAGRSAMEQYRAMYASPVYQVPEDFPKPIIAMINGFCLGGGCELAMACDIRVAADTAKFGQPEVNLGILPGGGGTQRLPRLVGLGVALRLLYTGQIIDAAEALRIGLVDEVVPAAELRPRTMTLAETIAAKSPIALQLIKEAVRASVRSPLDDGLRHEKTLFGLAFSSRDKEEGVSAFLEKRQPKFTGE